MQTVISEPNDDRLEIVIEFGKMCLDVSGMQGKRVKQLSKDKATSSYYTCNRIVELFTLIQESCEYICHG